jgi:hypothetical protein
MKRIIFLSIYCIIYVNTLHSQTIPNFVQQRLDSAKIKARMALEEVRICENRYREREGELPYANNLSTIFSHEEREQINSLGLKLNLGMIFDDAMRNRLVQLLKNEYQENELDTLVNFYINVSVDSRKKEALEECKFDTLTIFKMVLDSLYTDIKNKNPEDSLLRKFEYVEKNKYKYEVFQYLKLDTTQIFKQAYNRIIERDREMERESFLKKSYFDSSIAELCGYIGDKRFVKPLIEALGKAEEYQIDKVLEALVRMRVEPYYSNYVKHRTLTMKEIKDETKWLDFEIDDFVYVLGTQEAFRELSKYLLSKKPYQIIDIDYEDYSESISTPVSLDAFFLIQDNIENKDLQELMSPEYAYQDQNILKQVYDWMQKNYGKYKIRRLW